MIPEKALPYLWVAYKNIVDLDGVKKLMTYVMTTKLTLWMKDGEKPWREIIAYIGPGNYKAPSTVAKYMEERGWEINYR